MMMMMMMVVIMMMTEGGSASISKFNVRPFPINRGSWEQKNLSFVKSYSA